MTVPDTSPEFFERMFHGKDDPWNFAADEYEQHRYRTIVQALAPGGYRRAWEPGCSVGALTEKLAALADRVDASDFSPSAAGAAQKRCRHLPGVSVRCAAVTDPIDYGAYDLLLLSELGYYFSSERWSALVQSIVSGMQPGATLLAAHWLGTSPDHRMSGDEVHDMMKHPHLVLERSNRHPDAVRGGFRLDRWKRVA